MTHANAPLTFECRRRLIDRCRTRPISHVAAEMGISRATASNWVNRYRRHGKLGLLDRSSAPANQPAATPGRLVVTIETDAARAQVVSLSNLVRAQPGWDTGQPPHVTRLLAQLGLNRRKFIDPNGETSRQPQPISATHPGHMVYIDVK